jgi:hypothetical protein
LYLPATVAVVLFGGDPASAQQRPTVAQLIARVRENEARYDNLEVRTVAKTRYVTAGAGDPKSEDTQVRTRSVRQKGMVRVEEEAHQGDRRVPAYRFRSAFDGMVARINRDGDLTTLPRGVRHDEGVFQPHNLAVGLDLFVPLSVWLGSGPDLRAHRGARIGWSEADIRPRLAGRERVRGIDCEKVVCSCFFADGKGGWQLGETITLWLSPAHNHLVVQEECVKADTPDAVHSTTACEDFREVRPGLWLPFKTTLTRYDRFSGPRIKDHTVTTEVERLLLDPNYPVEVFRDVTLPALPK